jgi:methylenetetrahydrofolate reductase (NADPH)
MARRPAALDEPSRRALATILAAPTFELLPLKSVDAEAAFLPPGSTVSVTASPAKGLEATVEVSSRLAAHGFRVVAHLSARMVRDGAHLADLLAGLRAGGVDRAFVVGGDATEPGAFPDGLSLLRAMAEQGHHLVEIGIPAYPEGHPSIAAERLNTALADKQPYASYMTTQMCFDPRAIATWLAGRRAAGIGLPVHVGLPGVADMLKLIEISAKIGVTDSRRFISKNVGFVRHLVRPGGYHPDQLLQGLAPTSADPAADIRDLHVFTFNQVETTELWRRRYLASLQATTEGARA